MKITFYAIYLLVFITILNHCKAQSNPFLNQDITINVDPEKPLQKIDGWGGSLYRWTDQVGHRKESKTDSFANLITSLYKLNINILYHNIGKHKIKDKRISIDENCRQLPSLATKSNQLYYSAPVLSLSTFIISIIEQK